MKNVSQDRKYIRKTFWILSILISTFWNVALLAKRLGWLSTTRTWSEGSKKRKWEGRRSNAFWFVFSISRKSSTKSFVPQGAKRSRGSLASLSFCDFFILSPTSWRLFHFWNSSTSRRVGGPIPRRMVTMLNCNYTSCTSRDGNRLKNKQALEPTHTISILTKMSDILLMSYLKKISLTGCMGRKGLGTGDCEAPP